jgi:S-(hydroxymethyl)glutathione dehydrogenase/alcohol dehydrogenase
VIQGARLAGAAKIIAVDLADNKLEMARTFGATDTVNGSDGSAVAKIMELTGGIGADYTFEAVGIPALMQQTEQACRRGGTATIVGVGKLTDTVGFNALLLSLGGKTIKGSFYGDVNPAVDFPTYLDLYRTGKLNLDDMVTSTYSIDEAPQAIEDMQKGINARGVIVY